MNHLKSYDEMIPVKDRRKYLIVIISCRIRKKKVKCTLVQALRLCTGRTAHTGSRDIAVTFL